MFCPKCSQQQFSEDLRFCPRCGFPVGAVRELVSREEARGGGDAHAADVGRLPAQKDISTGALLMFAGGVVAVLSGVMGAREPESFFILGLALVFLLTLFHPMLRGLEGAFSGGEAAPHTPRRRDGINLGAVLMFAGTLKAMLATSYLHPGPERGVTAFLIMAGMLLLLLFLRPLLRAAHALFFRKGVHAGSDSKGEHAGSDATARLDSAQRGAALPPARAIPADAFAASGADTGEMSALPSVTEDTTRKLSDL